MLGFWPIVGIVTVILVAGVVGSKVVNTEPSGNSYGGGRTRRNRKGSRRFKK